MGRGISVHQSLTGETPPVKDKPGKGRNKALVAERNNDLFHRYYYYSRIHHMKYDDTLDMLNCEFRINKATIGRILIGHSDATRKIFDAKPSINTLKQMFPLFNWRPYKKPGNMKK